MRLRQVVVAAAELEKTEAACFELFGLNRAYLDPGVAEFGLVNSVMALGDDFFEIVTPSAPQTAAGRMLVTRGMSCGYMLLFQVDDFSVFDQRRQALGMRKVWDAENAKVSACHLHPKDIGGAIASFDEMRPPADWVWGGPDWRSHRASQVSGVLGATLAFASINEAVERWSAVLDRPARETADGYRIDLDAGTFIDIIPADGGFEGIRAFTFECSEPGAMVERAQQIGLGQTPRLGDLELRFEQPSTL
jgi:hypothetical protein